MNVQANTIGDLLVKDNRLQQADLDRAWAINGHQSNGIGPLLVRLDLVSDKDLVSAYARRYALPVLQDDELPETLVDNDALSVKFLKAANIAPIHETAEQLCIAVTDPED